MILPLVSVLLIAALWSGYWLIAFGKAKAEVAQERAKWADRGVKLACVSESWGGYPFRFEFACLAPAVSIAGSRPASVRWENVLVVAQAYNPFHIIALADGPGTVADASGTRLLADAGRSLASLRISQKTGKEIAIDIPRIDVPGVGKADRLVLNATLGEDDSIAAIFALERPVLRLPDSTEDGADRLAIDVSIPPAWLRGHVASAAALINAAELQRGALRITGHGTMGLDDARRLEGRVETNTSDIDKLLDVVAPHAGMNEKDRAAIKTLLGLLGGTGGGNAVHADLIAKAGEIYWGPIRITALPPLY
jgi:hypothetical protein